MEASSSSRSSPLSVHARTEFIPNSFHRPRHRRVSAKFAASLCPSRRFSLSTTNSSPRSANSSSYFCISISPGRPLKSPSLSSSRKRIFISAVFERFTERSIKAVMFSQREAKALGNEMVLNQHLLLGLISESGGSDGFLGSGITIDVARDAVRSIWHNDESGDGDLGGYGASFATDVPFSVSTKRVFEAAVEYSRTMGYNFIAPEHIAIGLFAVDDGSAGRVLKRLGANINHLAAEAVLRLRGELAKDGREQPTAPKRAQKLFPAEPSVARPSEKTREKSALAQFCLDLTAHAIDGLIDPVIGRETEVERMTQILCRRTKNNPILLGEAGVGKTAIAEGLAINIAQGNVPVFLSTKRIMALDIGLLIAGTKERGEFEARVTTLIKEVKKSVHTVIGSGTAGRGRKSSGLDIANLLKPSLGRGELQCIACTTMDEFRKHFEKDKALARRFQPVMINEPSQEDAVRILLGVREKYEAHHKCKYTLEALHAAVELAARYIPDRLLPDKAIDLIDEAGSKARMEYFKRRKEQQTSILSKSPDDYWQEIRAAEAIRKEASKLGRDDCVSSIEDDSKLSDTSLFDCF
ncbi:chaperone protein ClpD, chloroplastic-like isoform X2 [Actinidia eriantha]|uniref:chaperone protein ClpD, chloroplastic-like isoform X2 n=1 Tax=Actinidia eriantha TaxID=165200 RepID=UPI002584CD05|nr:chaperone protein ClpD, chloroplastic-like isoform X2 [Actinidia eriantha]